MDQLSDEALVHKTPFTKASGGFCHQTEAVSYPKKKRQGEGHNEKKKKHRRPLRVHRDPEIRVNVALARWQAEPVRQIKPLVVAASQAQRELSI